MEAKTYIMKPVCITAIQWTGKNFDEIAEWTDGAFTLDYIDGMTRVGVRTLFGFREVSVGDFIVNQNDRYDAIRQEEFDAKYIEKTEEHAES